jgi:mono/diheme cytochrome c family protein
VKAPLLNAVVALAALAAGAYAAAVHASPAQDYMLYCMGCHGVEAQGVPGKVPPLAGTVALFMRTPEGRDYVLRVPGAANSALPDAQLAAVLNWLAEHFPAADQPLPAPFSAEELARVRRTPLANVQERRREVVRALAASGAAPAAQY